MQPLRWHPPVSKTLQEEQIVRRIRKAKLFVFLHRHRHEVFDKAFQQKLAALYRPSRQGIHLSLPHSLPWQSFRKRLIERTIELASHTQAFGPRA